MGKVVGFLFVLLIASTVTNTSYLAQQDFQPVLMPKIREARLLLRDEQVQLQKGVVGTRRVRISRRRYQDVPITGITGREIALAVLKNDGTIDVARAIKRDSGLEVMTPGFVISIRRENGINSDFQIISPVGGRVLAMKYPVSNEGARFGMLGPEFETIYTPYSAEIKTSDVVAAGVDTLDRMVDTAYARLGERNVYSRAFQGRKIVDVIPPHLVKVLLMNEHIDPGEFTVETKTKQLVERVLTCIATNEKDAYAYSISSAGARGLVQMIPSTYALMLSRYPAARLNPNFSSGMTDPTNAIIAQLLLCDADWYSIREVNPEITVDRVGPYLAAAYNGGVGRVISAIRNDGEAWMEAPHENSKPSVKVSQRVPVRVRKGRRIQTVYVTKTYTRPVFRSETSKYVSQYHWIDRFLSQRTVRSGS